VGTTQLRQKQAIELLPVITFTEKGNREKQHQDNERKRRC
jgi:hypothetical protein